MQDLIIVVPPCHEVELARKQRKIDRWRAKYEAEAKDAVFLRNMITSYTRQQNDELRTKITALKSTNENLTKHLENSDARIREQTALIAFLQKK